jgi:DNA-binding transcriptional MerR regulator
MKAAIERLYYSITEVSKLIGEEQHVLRYWEREFQQLRPQKNRAGNRVYTAKDLGVLRVIKRLLREERYTVAGAKEHLRQFGVDEVEEATPVLQQSEAENVAEESTQVREIARTMATELRKIAADLRMRGAGVRT